MKKIITILASLVFIQVKAQICLSTSDSTLVFYRPSSVCSADFNKDGKIDIATAHNLNNSVSVLLNNGTAYFSPITNYSISTSPYAILSADFNSDGSADLATTNTMDNSVSILLGDGTGAFAAGNTTINIPGIYPTQITSTDFNGDGKTDLATANQSNNNVTVLLGNGLGSFTVNASFSVDNGPVSICHADFNADGKMDLVTANSGTCSISVLQGNGDGSFKTAVNYMVGCGPNSITTADFNGDGKADLAVANGVTGTVSVLLNDGAGGFTTNSYYAGNTLVSVINGDLNGDGKTDLATLNLDGSYIYNNVGVSFGDGAGNFSNVSNFVLGGFKKTITGADFNGDGLYDVAVTDTMNNMVKILLSSLQTIQVVSSANNFCVGTSATLTASGATSSSYTWSTGATTATISVSPLATTTYYVTNISGTCNEKDSVIINVGVPATPNICMVTTDSATNYKYNVIYWDKTTYTNVDSFIVYRKDAITTNYLRIGAVSKAALSEFVDTLFTIGGPNGGNPQYSSWSYKLAIRDTCGNIGNQSPFHQTMFVQENGSNFSWTAYTIESGQTNPITGYSFLRDDNSNGNWQVLVNTIALSTTDPTFSNYPKGNWRIDALGFNCTPTYRLANTTNTFNTYSRSHSNTTAAEVSGITKTSIKSEQVTMYPNPNNGFFVIETNAATRQILQVFDVNGKVVLSENINGKTTIDASNLNEGVYTLSIISNEGVVNKRFVIAK